MKTTLHRFLARITLVALVTLPQAAQAAVTFVEAVVPTPSSGAVNSLTVNKPTALATGDVLLALVADRGGNTTTVSSVPAGWSQILAVDDAANLGMNLYRKVVSNAATEATSYTWGLSGSVRAHAVIVVFRGVDTTTPINVSGSQINGASSTYTAPSVTTTVANTMLVAFFGATNGGATVAAPTGMTEAFDSGTSAGPNGLVIESAYAIQAATGATGARTSTGNSSLTNTGLLVALRPSAAIAVDHYELSLPTSSLTCLPTTVTVTACANSSSPCTSAATTVSGATATLATSGATLGATSVTFNASGVATTTLSYPAAPNNTAVSVTLSGESTAATNARQCCPNGSSCAVANSCTSAFNSAGFIVASAANGSATTVPAQTAGTASASLVLRAVQTNTSTQVCEAALTGATTVNWAYECDNPATCSASNLMSVNGGTATTVQRNNNAGVSAFTAVPMTFDANGNAPFTFTFNDVGQTTLWASKAVNAAILLGSSNAFVTRPAGFVLSSIQQTASPNLANPAASSASGGKFVKAGENFSATVTAVTSGGAATPNYGKEASAEGVLLTRALVQPAGGAAGTLANGNVAGASFNNGAATVSNLSFSEVGIITLTPSVVDGDYLGAGNVTGTSSANVGRFVPAQFALSAASTTHRASLACSPASGFSYLGENFRLGFTLTAQNTAAATTTNYSGSFAKLDPTVASAYNLVGRDAGTVFSVANTRLALGTVAGSWSNGVATAIAVTANAARAAAPDGPFSAAFGIAPVDSDGVAMAAFDMASAFGGSNDRATIGTVALRFGRLRLANAVGSQTRSLALPLTAQSWTGIAFDTNTLDSCTMLAATSVSFGNLRKTLTVADTAVSGTTITLTAGVGRLLLLAPTGGRSGSADVVLSLGSSATDASCLQPWTPGVGDAASTGASLIFLRGAWCASSFDNDPSARATWGLYRGADSVLYQRENY